MGIVAAKRGQKARKKKVEEVVVAHRVKDQIVSDAGAQESSPATMTTTVSCANCGETSRCRRRQFSEQAWTVLLLWNEISPSVVDRPICSDCYEELREILIERTDEVEAVMRQQSDEVAEIREKLGSLAS